MKLRQSFVLALALTLVLLTIWETWTRREGYMAAINDDKALWAVRRAKLGSLTERDVVVIGSSRAHFDIQLDEWEKVTGRRPLMLANDGATPTPVFRDIVENTDFNGTVLIGVSPGLFFSAPVEMAPPWKRAQARVDHYYDRTWAQRANHHLSLPLERTFAFLNASEEDWDDDIDLRSMISRIRTGDRLGKPAPPFYNFSYVDEERNTYMFDKTVTDTAFANSIKRVWMFFGEGAPPPVKDEIISLYQELIMKFRARGGTAIFVRYPSIGDFLEAEKMTTPRDQFWDELLVQTGTPGYHFEDHDVLKQFDIPEWSHLSTPDARIFTTHLAGIMLRDGVLSSSR
jgi:hypothetical protein